MQNIYFLLLTVSLVIIGCGKEDTAVIDYPAYNQKYELRIQTGGIAGGTKTFAAGNGNLYLFENGGSYKLYTDGQLSKSGSYKIIQDSSLILHQPASRIIFDNEASSMRTMIKFSGNNMMIWEDVYDGMNYGYEKIK